MADYHSIYWSSGEARLKAYSAALSSRRGRAKDVTVVKVEIEVTDSYRLGSILDQLSAIRRAQDEQSDNKKAARKGPLLLAYGDSQ